MVLIIPDGWHDIEDIFNMSQGSPIRVLVLGSKGVGKSTFTRFFTGKLGPKIGALCRIETDCGQPDFSPPGVLNLAVLRNNEKIQVVSQRYVGFVTPSVNPIAYVECIEKLFKDYEGRFANIPLIVNLHGWNMGMGRKTYEAAIHIIKPDFVVHIGSSKEDPSFAVEPINPFISIFLPAPQPSWLSLAPVVLLTDDEEGRCIASMTARDKRWVKYATHFRPDLVIRNEYKSAHPRDFFLSPFCRLLSLSKASVSVSLPYANTVPQDPFKLLEQLLVGLCNSASGQCVCLGFVDSIDDEGVYVVIPPNIPKIMTDSIDEIVKGEMNWSPREQISYNGKTTSTDFTTNPEGEPYFLTRVLVDDDIAKTASTRTNLGRKRLS